jgi:hypothetical protein
MLTTMIMRWRVLIELCQRFPKMRFWPGYLSRSRTTRGCSVSRFLEHILDVFLICDLKKKVSVWIWSCLGTLLYEPKRNDWLKHLSADSFWLSMRFLKVVVITRTLTLTLLTSPALALTTWTRNPRSSARIYEEDKNPGFVGLMGGAYNMLKFSESEDPEKTCQ